MTTSEREPSAQEGAITEGESIARQKIAAVLDGQPRRVQKHALKNALRRHRMELRKTESGRRQLARELAAIGYVAASHVPAILSAPPTSTHAAVLALHHATLRDMAYAAQITRGVRPEDVPDHAELVRLFPGWTSLREHCQVARLFEMPAAQWPDIWSALGALVDSPDAWPADAITFPQHWPFDACYFAWGTGIPVKRALWADSADDDPGVVEGHVRILAHLITSDGIAAALLAVNHKGHDTLWADLLARDGQWFRTDDQLSPWFVHMLHRMATGRGTRVAETPEILPRRERRRLAREGYVPTPYYVVTLQRAVIRPTARFLPHQFRGYSHRFDVRGHASHRVAHGSIPIDPKRYRALVKRGYRFVHALAPLDHDTATYVRQRGIPPPSAGEWLAVLTSWRRAFVKGPASKPYVPSVRRVVAETRGAAHGE